MRVLIVDDSTVYRSQIRAALTGMEGIDVVGSASNGRLAIEFLKSRPVDIITLDLEMPEMDGLQFLAEFRRLNFAAKIIVFSAHSRAGAESAFQALRAGAVDVIAKPTLTAEDADPAALIRRHLLPKIMQFASAGGANSAAPPVGITTVRPAGNLNHLLPRALVIASSTGGPAALERLFSLIAPPFACPIFIAQHMPPIFTATLGERLSRICGATVAEPKHLERVQNGRVYIAPGDFHMRVQTDADGAFLALGSDERRNSVRPAADYLFETASVHYRNSLLGVVLTGMGADGKDGALAIKKQGGGVLIQDRESCVVFGMPGAVFDAGAYDFMGNLETLARKLIDIGIAVAPLKSAVANS